MKSSIIVEGITLAYVEANPNQLETLFFVHNNSGSSSIWAQQLKGPPLSRYRIVAFDLPAHGESSASETPERHYGLKDLGRIVGRAIGQLTRNENYILVGASLGTNIISEALIHCKPKGMVLAGPTVVGREVSFSSISKPGVDTSPLFLDRTPREAVHHLFSCLTFAKDPALLQMLLRDYHEVKAPFRSMMLKQSLEDGRLSDELGLLNESGVSALVVIGEADEVIRPDYLDDIALNKWNDELYKISEAGHLVHLDQAKVFNDLLMQYAEAIFKGCPAS